MPNGLMKATWVWLLQPFVCKAMAAKFTEVLSPVSTTVVDASDILLLVIGLSPAQGSPNSKGICIPRYHSNGNRGLPACLLGGLGSLLCLSLCSLLVSGEKCLPPELGPKTLSLDGSSRSEDEAKTNASKKLHTVRGGASSRRRLRQA